MVAAYCLRVVRNNTLTSVCIIPLDWGMTTRRSVLRLVGTTLLPGGGSGGGGDLGGMIFPKLLPPGEPKKPFTEHRNVEIWGHLRNDGEENHNFPFTTDWLTDGEHETCICALCSNFSMGYFQSLLLNILFSERHNTPECRTIWRFGMCVKTGGSLWG